MSDYIEFWSAKAIVECIGAVGGLLVLLALGLGTGFIRKVRK